MNHRLIVAVSLMVLVVGGGSAGTALAAGEGYIQFVSANPIDYEGTLAWEYYYDV